MRLLDRAHQGRDAYIPALTPERSSPYTHLAWSALKSQDVRRGPVVKEELIYWTPLKERKRYLGVQWSSSIDRVSYCLSLLFPFSINGLRLWTKQSILFSFLWTSIPGSLHPAGCYWKNCDPGCSWKRKRWKRWVDTSQSSKGRKKWCHGPSLSSYLDHASKHFFYLSLPLGITTDWGLIQ